MTTEPRLATPDEVTEIDSAPPVVPIRWQAYADGRWWLVHEDPAASDADAARAHKRIQVGSGRWAVRNGYERETRRRRGGRQVWVRFTQDRAIS